MKHTDCAHSGKFESALFGLSEIAVFGSTDYGVETLVR